MSNILFLKLKEVKHILMIKHETNGTKGKILHEMLIRGPLLISI